MTICDRCGAELHIGDFPFCKGNPLHHSPGVMRVNGDECDYIDHNLAREPIRIRSWSQRRALMAAAGLQDFAYDVPVPDGVAPNAQRPSRWGAYRQCDPEHLAWLASKLSTGKATKVDDDAAVKVTVRTGTISASDVEKL